MVSMENNKEWSERHEGKATCLSVPFYILLTCEPVIFFSKYRTKWEKKQTIKFKKILKKERNNPNCVSK